MEINDRSAEWKNDRAEKAQSFVAAASASKQEDSLSEEYEDAKDKKAFMKSFMASSESSQRDKKAQKNKIKRSDNDTSESEQNYSTCFKIVALKPRGTNIGIPATESIGETTVNGTRKPLHIVMDTGSSRSIIFKKFINKSY
jgi:lysyl-tRNA synthetase class I